MSKSGDKLKELERRIEELERQPRYYPPVFDPKPLSQGQCLVCGGYHGGLPCPRMTPTC